ncbi:MAG: nucleotidyltransferase family protein [Prevotella sp.]
MENMFFEFLQIAVGNRKSLSVGIYDSDWKRLFDLFQKQALIGIGFTAVEKLHADGVVCPSQLRMKWMVLALQIEKHNALLNEQCKILTKQYGHDGLATCILKGQGNMLNYPEELRMRRQSGDIDVWCVPPHEGLDIAVQSGKDEIEYVNYKGYHAVMEYVLMQHRLAGNNKKPVIRYHHIEAPKIDGTEIEVHFRVGYTNSPLRNWRMMRWFKDNTDVCMKNKTYMGFAVPTASVNVVFLMCHLFSHYFDEGVGLRQLMDYYFALRVWHNDVMERKDLQSQGMWSEGLGTPVMSKDEVMSVLLSFGMGKFSAAVMFVLHEVFAMPTHYYICEPNEKEGRRLLAEIMQGGNFGQYDTRDAALKRGGFVKHGLWKLKRIMRLIGSYPEEALWEPVFRVYHLIWRLLH